MTAAGVTSVTKGTVGGALQLANPPGSVPLQKQQQNCYLSGHTAGMGWC